MSLSHTRHRLCRLPRLGRSASARPAALHRPQPGCSAISVLYRDSHNHSSTSPDDFERDRPSAHSPHHMRLRASCARSSSRRARSAARSADMGGGAPSLLAELPPGRARPGKSMGPGHFILGRPTVTSLPGSVRDATAGATPLGACLRTSSLAAGSRLPNVEPHMRRSSSLRMWIA